MPLKLTEAFVTLSAKNFEPLVQFYCQLLERSPDVYSPERYAEFQLPGMKLGIFRPKVEQDGEGGGEERMAICLEVEDLEEAIAHLGAIGYPPLTTIITASHGREIDAYDPDGNWLILHQA